MKWLLGLFISVFLLTPHKGSSDNCAFFEDVNSQCFVSNFLSKTDVKNAYNTIAELKAPVSNSSSNNNQLPYKNKKKNKKGFKSIYSYLSVNCISFTSVSDNKNYFFKQNSIIACVFFGNGKRGPPYLLIHSF